MRHRKQKCQDLPLIAERSTPGVIFYPSAEWRQPTIWRAFYPKALLQKALFIDRILPTIWIWWLGNILRWSACSTFRILEGDETRKLWPRVGQLWSITGAGAYVLRDPKKGADSGSGNCRQGMRGHHWIGLPEIYMWNLFLNIRIAIFKLRKLSWSLDVLATCILCSQRLFAALWAIPWKSTWGHLQYNPGRVQQNLGRAPHHLSRLQPPLDSLSVTAYKNLNFFLIFSSVTKQEMEIKIMKQAVRKLERCSEICRQHFEQERSKLVGELRYERSIVSLEPPFPPRKLSTNLPSFSASAPTSLAPSVIQLSKDRGHHEPTTNIGRKLKRRVRTYSRAGDNLYNSKRIKSEDREPCLNRGR